MKPEIVETWFISKAEELSAPLYILLYSSQVSVLGASSGQHFLNGSTERNNVLVTMC